MNFSLSLFVFSSPLKNSPHISVSFPSSQFRLNGWIAAYYPQAVLSHKTGVQPLPSATSQLQLPPWSSQVWYKTVHYGWEEDCSPDDNMIQAKLLFLKEGIFRILWRLALSFPNVLICYFLYFNFLLLCCKRPRNCEIFLLLKHVRCEKKSDLSSHFFVF